MATLPALTETNVGEIVKSKNKLYQPEGPRIPGDARYQNKPTLATPKNLAVLLDELGNYTKAVRAAAERFGLTEDTVQVQWQKDMANWQYRLGHYYGLLRLVPQAEMENEIGADRVYFTVTSPLLDGVFYEGLPGIMLSAQDKAQLAQVPSPGTTPKPPDLYTPFALGNQVIEYREHQLERWEKLWSDLADSAKRLGLPPGMDPLGAFVHTLVTVASGLVGAALTYGGIVIHQRRQQLRMMGAGPR